MTLSLNTTLEGRPATAWDYVLTEKDYSRDWYPKPKRLAQLAQNTIMTQSRVISGIWACGRAMGPYKGRFPNGMMERVETAIYTFFDNEFNPDTSKILFPFGGSIVKKDNLHTIDINCDTNPTYCGNITDQSFLDTIPNDYYDHAIIDPPYDTVDWFKVINTLEHHFKTQNLQQYEKFQSLVNSLANAFKVQQYSEELYDTRPISPYSFLGTKKGSNIVPKIKVGGTIWILHQLVYKNPSILNLKPLKRIGVIAITTGPNMRIRVLNVFKRTH